MRLKTQIYALIVSAIISLITVAVIKSTPTETKPMTTVQQLDALGKIAPKGSGVSKIIQRQKDAQQDNDQAAKDLSK
jgi:hypothetical protein